MVPTQCSIPTGFVVQFLAYKPSDSGPPWDPNGNQVIPDTPAALPQRAARVQPTDFTG
jgi:hypothetical protein